MCGIHPVGMAQERQISLGINAFEIRIKIEEIDEDRTQLGHLLVLDGVTEDPKLAACIAAGAPCPDNKMSVIDSGALEAIAKFALGTEVYKGEKYVICVILASAPRIGVILDRGSFKKKSRDPFHADVAREAQKKTDKHIPMILVNPNIPFSALTYVDL